MEELIGIITEIGTVRLDDNREFYIDRRGTDDEDYPEVLIDAKSIGGRGWMARQSIKPLIGLQCKFVTVNGTHGYNFEII